jgi:hypothetical protein
MPPRPDDSRRQKIVLPIALVLIFAACIGVAAGVNELKRARLVEGLADPIAAGSALVRLPEGWTVHRSHPSMGWPFETESPEVELIAREPGEGRVRVLRVRTIPQWTGGDRFRSLYQLIDLPVGTDYIDALPIPFAGNGRGYLLQAERATTGERVARHYLIALGTADERTAVYVVLDSPNRLGDDDLQLISRVALSIRAADSER